MVLDINKEKTRLKVVCWKWPDFGFNLRKGPLRSRRPAAINLVFKEKIKEEDLVFTVSVFSTLWTMASGSGPDNGMALLTPMAYTI